MSGSMIFNLALGVFVAWMVYNMLRPIKGMTSLGAAEFKKRLSENKSAMLIDVREPHEFRGGSIPKAVNMPLSSLRSQLANIPMDREVFIYCKSGLRSKKAAALISKAGHRQIINLQGGILSWK
jgi:rhodanese-related sulfurtransferase